MPIRQSTYRVVFWGEVMLGRDKDRVAEQFAKWFKVNDSRKLKQLFSGRLLVLKKSLDYSEAKLYRDVLQGIGAMCRIEREHHVLDGPIGVVHQGGVRAINTQNLGTQVIAESVAHGAAVELQLLDEKLEEETQKNPFAVRDTHSERHPPCKYYDPYAADTVLKKVITGS